MSLRVEIIRINDWLGRKYGIESGDVLEVTAESKMAIQVGCGVWIPKSQIVFTRLDSLDRFTQ